MNDSKRAVQRGTEMAREGIERGTRAAEEGMHTAESSYSAGFDNMREWQTKLFEIAQQNTRLGLEFVTDLTNARSPADLAQVWTSYSRKQFEMLSSQTKQLAEVSQRFASESMRPIMQSAARTVSDEEV